MAKRWKRWVIVAGVVIFIASVLAFLFLPSFDDKYLDIELSRIQDKYPGISVGKAKIKASALIHVFQPFFSIPLDDKYELFLYKIELYSKYTGSYQQWFLYPEPLYRSDYMAHARETGQLLTPSDFCKHYLSEYIRSQVFFDDDLATQWHGEAHRLSDGNHAFSIGMSAISGSGIKVVVDKDGKLVKYEHLFSGI